MGPNHMSLRSIMCVSDCSGCRARNFLVSLMIVAGVAGQPMVGASDSETAFLRVCRSTLADSKTSIAELYAGEFNGPVLRDFCGSKINGRRDAGAIEFR